MNVSWEPYLPSAAFSMLVSNPVNVFVVNCSRAVRGASGESLPSKTVAWSLFFASRMKAAVAAATAARLTGRGRARRSPSPATHTDSVPLVGIGQNLCFRNSNDGTLCSWLLFVFRISLIRKDVNGFSLRDGEPTGLTLGGGGGNFRGELMVG